jgi:hypothetical protein
VLDGPEAAAAARACVATLARGDDGLEELAPAASGSGSPDGSADAPQASGAATLSFAAATARLAQMLASVTAAAGPAHVIDLRVAETPLDEIFAALYRKPRDAEVTA